VIRFVSVLLIYNAQRQQPMQRRIKAAVETAPYMGLKLSASGALASRSNPDSAPWTLDCFGAKGRLAMTIRAVISRSVLSN
jgi:hypothetical protein